MTLEEHAVKLAEVDHRAQSNTRRIDKLEVQTEAVQKLATSVEVMVAELGHQTEAMERIETNVEKLDKRVETMEQKPAKRWDAIVDKILLAIIGALVIYALSKIGIA